jgi:hypothetical protein
MQRLKQPRSRRREAASSAARAHSSRSVRRGCSTWRRPGTRRCPRCQTRRSRQPVQGGGGTGRKVVVLMLRAGAASAQGAQKHGYAAQTHAGGNSRRHPKPRFPLFVLRGLAALTVGGCCGGGRLIGGGRGRGGGGLGDGEGLGRGGGGRTEGEGEAVGGGEGRGRGGGGRGLGEGDGEGEGVGVGAVWQATWSGQSQ